MLDNIKFKTFVSASKWLIKYDELSKVKKVLFYIKLPFNFVKFKNQIKKEVK